MGTLDIIFIVLFIGAIAYGWIRGFFPQLGAVGGIFLGILACRLFADKATAWLTPAGAGPNDHYISSVLANVLIFIVTYLLSRFVFHFVKGVTHALKLSVVDRLGGVVFALFEWFFMASLALNLWQAFQPSIDVTSHSHLDNGRVVRVVRDFAPKVLGSDTARSIFSVLK